MKNLTEINREQLKKIQGDEYFVHCHWNSQRALVSYIPPTARSFLDLGCGPNADLINLLPDMEYTGIDFVPEYLTNLRKQYPERGWFPFSHTRFYVASMESLPFADASYDVVYSRHTLEHVLDLNRALTEIKRVLKPGGIFIFCMPAAPHDQEPAHITRWDANQWIQAITNIVDVETFGQHDYFMDEVYGYGVKRTVTPDGNKAMVGSSQNERIFLPVQEIERLHAADALLAEILGSRAWRLVEMIRKVRLWFVPSGSRREKILSLTPDKRTPPSG